MYFKKAFRNLILKLLNSYVRKNTFISRCYVRHSMAFEAQNPFLSDFDLAFFVRANNFCELQKAHRTISKGLEKFRLFKKVASNFIVLPDTAKAYSLCRQYYSFRSIYPMQTWFLCGSNQSPMPAKIQHSIPLDHVPETALIFYMIPVLRKQRLSHPFERLLVKRMVQKDYLWAGVNGKRKHLASFHQALLTDIDIWGEFYKGMDYPNNKPRGIVFKLRKRPDYTAFINRWDIAQRFIGGLVGNVSSLWVHPSSIGDNWPNLVINFRPSISAQKLRRIVTAILRIFEGLNYNLLLGYEESMIGRISGLSRLNLLEPWLLKYYGCCLYGNPHAKGNIVEPSMDTLRKKYQESLLYLFSHCLEQVIFNYNFYKLCFTMDHLFKYGEIILEEDGLNAIYGNEFIPRDKFNYPSSLPSFLSSVEKRHDFSLF